MQHLLRVEILRRSSTQAPLDLYQRVPDPHDAMAFRFTGTRAAVARRGRAGSVKGASGLYGDGPRPRRGVAQVESLCRATLAVRAVGHRTAQSKKACAVGASLCFTSRNHTYKWWPGRESNPRHRDFQSLALPTELPGHCTRGQADVRGGMIRAPGPRGKPPVR